MKSLVKASPTPAPVKSTVSLNSYVVESIDTEYVNPLLSCTLYLPLASIVASLVSELDVNVSLFPANAAPTEPETVLGTSLTSYLTL